MICFLFGNLLLKSRTMKITYLENYAALSEKAAHLIALEVKQNPELMFCAATGGVLQGCTQKWRREKRFMLKCR